MSSWIHVNAAIRIDDLRLDDSIPDFEELIGKECLFESPEFIWDDMELNPDSYLPMGSEGSLQNSVWINPDKCNTASYSVMIFGDLRDRGEEDAEKVIKWFKDKCDKINKTYGVRDAFITVRVNTDKPLIFVYDPFEKYRDKNTEEENEEKIVDVFDTLDEKQKTVIYYLIYKIVEDTKKEIKNKYERKLRLYEYKNACTYEELFKENGDDK